MWVSHTVAARLALACPLAHPWTEDDLDQLYETMHLHLVALPCTFPLEEFRCGAVVGVRSDLPTSRRVWLKLHALGHALLHRGDQFTDAVNIGKQERQADLFAGFLAGVAATPGTPWEIAEHLGLPVDCIDHWLRLVTS